MSAADSPECRRASQSRERCCSGTRKIYLSLGLGHVSGLTIGNLPCGPTDGGDDADAHPILLRPGAECLASRGPGRPSQRRSASRSRCSEVRGGARATVVRTYSSSPLGPAASFRGEPMPLSPVRARTLVSAGPLGSIDCSCRCAAVLMAPPPSPKAEQRRDVDGEERSSPEELPLSAGLRSRSVLDPLHSVARAWRVGEYPQRQLPTWSYPQTFARLADGGSACDRRRHVGAETQQIGPG